jgi:hypothetical protein
MGILDAIKGKADELDKSVNPLRKVADTIETATKTVNPDPTGQKAAIAAGQAARQEAINRGKGASELPVTEVPDSNKVRLVR